ncbi:TPA: hypothetical protein HA278_06950 [Candidatus Woesearchaeota archaeon]|nr:hypothetical protein [Candidatus Woesearchaeota archaeon]
MAWNRKHWLALIFILTLTIRLIVAFSTPNFTYDSYFHLRQVEHITETGTPLFEDDLSYGGRELRFLPLFHYVMAFFDLFLPLTIVAKIIPNILIASLTLITYLITRRITKNDTAPLMSAFIAGFIPILFTPNAFTTDTLFLPLLFATIYAFMNLTREKFVYAYIGLFLATSVTSSSTFLLLIGFGIYLLLSKIENKRIKKEEAEVILFSLFFFVWLQFIFFKDVFLTQGSQFIWQNIPSQLLTQYFPQATIVTAIVSVSIIPFIAGIIVVYQSLFELKNTKAFLLISFVIATTILTWLTVIPFAFSLAFFSLVLAILFGMFYENVFNYIKKTKFTNKGTLLPILTVILLTLSMAIPVLSTAYSQEMPTQEEVDAFTWIDTSISANTTVVATLEEGHLVTFLSKKKNVMDTKFNLIPDTGKKLRDLNVLYTTAFQTQALEILHSHNAEYIVFTPQAKERFKKDQLPYLSPECFEPVYNKNVKIYKVKCIVRELE